MYVSTAGYRWLSTRREPGDEESLGWMLRPIDPEAPTRAYYPVGKDKVTTAFFDTAPTRQGFLTFANQWGPIMSTDPGEGSLLLFTWRFAHRLLKHCAEVWQKIKDAEGGDKEARAGLAGCFRWSEKGVIYAHDPNAAPGLDEPLIAPNDPAFKAFKPGRDTTVLARLLVGRMLTAGLGDETTPEMYVETQRKQKHKRILVRLRPRNLLGALWLTFAAAVADEVPYRHCQACKRYFPATRVDRVFCSAACRQANLRECREEARRLYQVDGQGVEAIARRMKRDAETVRGWIEGPAKKGARRG
jgi:hypothetical protein